MPILNIQLAAQDPSGRQIPPLVALQQRGPVVEVSISIEQNIAQQLLAQGISLPPPEVGLALIDSGATSTSIDDDAARKLRLPAIDIVAVASASHASTQQNFHPIQSERAADHDQCTEGDCCPSGISGIACPDRPRRLATLHPFLQRTSRKLLPVRVGSGQWVALLLSRQLALDYPGSFHPSQLQTARPMMSSLSRVDSQGISSVNMVTHCLQGQGMRVMSVPQNIRWGPKAS